MIAALLYLQFQSFKNRSWQRLRRLKRPKYLAGAIVGGLYFYFYFFRWLFLGGSSAPHGLVQAASGDNLALFESIGATVLFVIVLLSWLLPKDRAALAFSEAEVAFLFPAPISRRTLIHYKLLRSQIGILISTLVLTLVSGRASSGGQAWIRMVGWWLMLSTLNLHFLGASFARTLLIDRGISNWRRRAVVLLILAGLCATTLLWGRRTLAAPQLQDLDSLRKFVAYANQFFSTAPVPYILYPFRLLVRPCLAGHAPVFLRVFWPALGLLVAHYCWVVRSNVAFEEASVDLSRKLADRLAAVRSGRWPSGSKTARPKRPPFELRPTGLPAVALLWKNLIAAGQLFTIRFWLMLLWLAVVASFAVSAAVQETGLLTAISFLCLMLIVMSLLIGPQVVRHDFRQDLPVADILKLYPMRGWQVALGELLAPALILTAVQWCLLVLAVGLCAHVSSQTAIPIATRLSLGAGAAMVVPVLNVISLLIPNLAVLLFPGWLQSGKDSPQGIEATGQRLIFLLGQMLVFFIALIPAAISFTLIFFCVEYLAGWVAAVPPAAAVAAIVLGIEAAFGLRLLGRLFERLDLSAESQ